MFEITGRIYRAYPSEQKSATFNVRKFILELEEQNNGQVYKQYIQMQLVNANCQLLDNYQLGDVVKVSFNLRGNMYQGNNGEACGTNINAWKMELVQRVAQQQPQQQWGQQQYQQPPAAQQWGQQPQQPQQPQQWTQQPQQPQQWQPQQPPPAQQQAPSFNPETGGSLPF